MFPQHSSSCKHFPSSPLCPTMVQGDPKLLDDGGEIPKSQGRGWRFGSLMWKLFSTWHKLVRWSTPSCVLALAYRPSILKNKTLSNYKKICSYTEITWHRPTTWPWFTLETTFTYLMMAPHFSKAKPSTRALLITWALTFQYIELFGTITMLCVIDGIPQNIPRYSHIQYGEYLKIFHEILSIPHNIVMDLNNVMYTINNI